MNELVALPCMCASVRRAARAMTQLYEEELRPIGLRVTQFTVLQALALAGEVNQGELGRMLAMDSTTLTRTLKIMSGHGWVSKRQGRDRRELRIRLSKAGKEKLESGLPYWEKAQSRLRSRLGPKQWDALMKLSNKVTNEVAREGE